MLNLTTSSFFFSLHYAWFNSFFFSSFKKNLDLSKLLNSGFQRHSSCCAWDLSPLKLMEALSWASIRKRFHSQQESCNSITTPIHSQCLSKSGGNHHFLSNCWDNDQPKMWILITRVLKSRKETNIILFFFVIVISIYTQHL